MTLETIMLSVVMRNVIMLNVVASVWIRLSIIHLDTLSILQLDFFEHQLF